MAGSEGKSLWQEWRREVTCPGRDAAFFMPLRRTGTRSCKQPGPRLCSAPLRKGCTLRCVRGTPALVPPYVIPPSTTSSMPVTYLDSSDARYSAAFATSQASPMCPSAPAHRGAPHRLDIALGIARRRPAECSTIGVFIRPGRMQFTRIWLRANSTAVVAYLVHRRLEAP